PLQEGMLFHSLSAQGVDSYSRQLTFEMKGDLDVEAFECAWQRVVDRHAALRTSFLWQGVRNPLQLVYKSTALEFSRHDWRAIGAMHQGTLLDEFLLEERARSFDLNRPPLMRVALIRVAEDCHRFVWTYHHLIMDAWSRALIYREVLALYDA